MKGIYVNGIRGKLLEYLIMWVMLFWGHSPEINFLKLRTKKSLILTDHLNYEQRENIPLN